jgi:hypothetical protein
LQAGSKPVARKRGSNAAGTRKRRITRKEVITQIVYTGLIFNAITRYKKAPKHANIIAKGALPRSFKIQC